MAIDDLLAKFGLQGDEPGEVAITRYLPGEYSGGGFNAKVDRIFFLSASVQPIARDDVMREDKQFARSTNMVKIYTTEKILVDKQTGDLLQKADLIGVDGIIYEAQDCQNWNHLNTQHFKTIAVEKNVE